MIVTPQERIAINEILSKIAEKMKGLFNLSPTQNLWTLYHELEFIIYLDPDCKFDGMNFFTWAKLYASDKLDEIEEFIRIIRSAAKSASDCQIAQKTATVKFPEMIKMFEIPKTEDYPE